MKLAGSGTIAETYIAEAGEKDLCFIVDAQIAMAKETEGLTLDFDTVQKGVHAVFQNPHLGKYFVASSEDQTLACLLTIPEWSDWRNGTVLWIHSVYVMPAHRKQKVFQLMYNHLKTKVETSPGLRGLRLYVDKRNAPAQAVYQKLSMTKEHYDLFEWMLDT